MTYWIDNVSGNDSWDGTSATFVSGTTGPKATWAAGVALLTSKGDILNVINTGTAYQLSGTVTLPTGQSGTSFSDPSVTIQGTDVSGVASMPEIRWTDDNASEGYLRISTNSAYCILQGFHFNWMANSTSANAKSVVTRLASSASIRLQYCYFQGTKDIGGAIFKDNASFTTDGGEVRYNYFLNPNDGVQCLAPHGVSKWTCHNNVFVVDEIGNTGPAWCDLDNEDVGTTDHRVFNNTVLVYSAADVFNGPIFLSNENIVASGTPTKYFHSNVIANFGSTAVGVMEGNAGAGQQVNYTQLIGYNIFVDPGAVGWGTNGPYEQPFDPGDTTSTDVYGTDVETTDDPFADKSTPWDWDFEGSAYSVTLPGDLRLTAHRAASQSGGVPGAIAAAPALAPNPPAPTSPIPVPGGDAGGIGPLRPGILTLAADFDRRKNVHFVEQSEFRPDNLMVTEAIKIRYPVAPSSVVALPLPTSKMHLLLLSDSDVTVSIGNEDVLLLSDGAIFLSQVTVSSITITNAHPLREAVITYFGVA